MRFLHRESDYENFIWAAQLRKVGAYVSSLRRGSNIQVHSACLATSPANYWTVQDWRPTLFALRAFHVEIASIADHVKEALVVPMRMQWWRDAVNSLYKGTPIRHPVIQCLAQVHMDQLDSEHVHRGTPHRCINCECCQAMPTNMASRRERFLTAQPKCPLLTSSAAMQSTLYFLPLL